MDRAESTGLGVALIAHLAVLAWLSSNWLAKPVPPKPLAVPVTVSLVDAVALQSSAPAAVEAAPSQAPDLGPPEEAAPPPPTPAPPEAKPSPPDPAPPKPQPAPKPAEVAAPRPVPPKPAAKPAPALAKAPPQPTPARPAPKQLAANDAAKAPRPRGSRLDDAFLKGLVDSPSPSKTVAPKGAVIDAKALASIQDAIRRQIQPCADRQVNPGPGANEIVTTLNLRLNPDGSLADDPKVVRQAGLDGENNRYARRVIDLGIAAFKACSPLKLPSEYYQTANGGWGNINYNWQLR